MEFHDSSLANRGFGHCSNYGNRPASEAVSASHRHRGDDVRNGAGPDARAARGRDESVLVPASEVIHTDLIVSGASVRVDGTVEGDLIAFTGMLIVTGHVTG